MLVRAGERAESLAAAAEARRYFEQAAELTDDPAEKAALLTRAGEMAARTGDPDSARRLFQESMALYEEHDDTHAAARVMWKLGRVDFFTGRRDEAMAGMERAYAVISTDEPDEDLALLAARLSFGYWYGGDPERCAEFAEIALDIAEPHAYPTALVIALRAKAAVAATREHHQEAQALVKHALQVALDYDVLDEASICYFWLSDMCFQRDEYADALGYLDESIALARRRGDRPREWAVLAERTHPLCLLGRWDEVQATSDEFTQEQLDSGGLMLSLLQSAVEVHLQRGELERARAVLSMFSRLEESTDLQELSSYLGSRAALRRAEGRFAEALVDAVATFEAGIRMANISSQSAKQGIVEAIEAALALGEAAKVEELLALVEDVPLGTRPPFLDAQAKRFRARLSGDSSGFEAAAALFREVDLPFWLAVALLEYGEVTGSEESLSEAREIFDELRATPWLDRLDAVESGRTEVHA